jgi:hypothetical protein
MSGVNPQRGEVALMLDGVPRKMRLTLGAIAALEARLEAGGLIALAERFEGGAVSAADLLALLSAGLAGAREPVTEADLAAGDIGGGAVGALTAGLSLMTAAFQPEP